MMMANVAEIMKRAWVIFRDKRDHASFGEALRMSWAIARGFSAGFETSYVDAGRIVRVNGFAASTDEARTDCIEAKRWIVAAGFKPTGSSEFSLRRYMPVQASEAITNTAHPVRIAA